MTPERKKMLKVVALTAGTVIIVTVIVILIAKAIKNRRQQDNGFVADQDVEPSKSAGSVSSGSSSGGSLGGRTFTATEIEKMQSFLLNMAAMARNQYIIDRIRATGGIDGKMGTGFKDALNESIRIGIVQNLDDLYLQALKHA